MSEQEVIKHTKKIFGIWTTQSTFLHKVSEFVSEILIIMFAITLSIYFHDRSELRHQRRETKEFLLGLREDLKTDIAEMEDDKNSYEKGGLAFKYIARRKLNEPLNGDSIDKYKRWILNTTGLIPNNGRFEGFKSSGKIGTIEDKELQNNIMDLYQEDIPTLLASTNAYISRKLKLFDYLAANAKRITDTTNNFLSILAADEGFNLCSGLTFVREILDRYDVSIKKMRTIIQEIDKDYGQ
jgi:hypothetical protein